MKNETKDIVQEKVLRKAQELYEKVGEFNVYEDGQYTVIQLEDKTVIINCSDDTDMFIKMNNEDLEKWIINEVKNTESENK